MVEFPSNSTPPSPGLTTERDTQSGETEVQSLQLNSELNQTFSDVLFNSLSSLAREAELSSESNGVHIERGAISLLESVRGGLEEGEGRTVQLSLEPVTTEKDSLSPEEEGYLPNLDRRTFLQGTGGLLIAKLRRTKQGTDGS